MCCFFFFFKQKTAYEIRISDWSSDVCSSDLAKLEHPIVNHIIRAMEDVMESDKQMSNVTGRLDTEGRVEGGIRFYTDRFRTAYGAAGTTSTRLSSKSSDFWD